MLTKYIFLCYNTHKGMRKFLTCIFAIMVVSPDVFASTGGFSRVLPTESGDAMTTATRTSGSRSGARSDTESKDATALTSRATATNNVRNTVSRVFTGNNSVAARGTVLRPRGVLTDARSGLDAAVNTVGRNDRVKDASFNSNPAVRRAGLVLRPSTAEVGGRATIGDTGIQTGSNIDSEIRKVQSRAILGSKQVEVTAESIAAAKEKLEQTASLNKSCQDQYNECMDQFCAVVDANQKRCSCSANLSKYIKSEQAVKDANVELNEVAQRIRYVGLSADEIRAIMEETEAEEALSSTKDTSETRSLLAEIEDMIRDPVSSSATYSESETFGLDIDLDFSSDEGDMFSLDFLNGNSSSSMANLRGAELYKAAKKRCNTVLTQCKEAGATSTQITGNYDLAIDKDCIAYEQGLTKMNETLVSNVRSANRMLQKARLAVLQNKNQYDAKGCIAALNTCMTDDMVCGSDYYKCIDPTKQYIDENGQVVLGQNISNILEFMKEYNNASITSNFLKRVYDTQQINEISCKAETVGADGSPQTDSNGDILLGNNGACVIKYLLTKIGTKPVVTDEGLCRAVLDKCQRYTYDTNDNYKPYNDVVVNYVQRAMTNIRSAQQNIVYEYASSCMQDVAECYNQQLSRVNSWASGANPESIMAVMRGACRNVALTCAYAIFYDPNESGSTSQNSMCDTPDNCIDNMSALFYQSLLCPANSMYRKEPPSEEDYWGNNKEWVNENCKCYSGYVAWGNQCMLQCGENEQRNSSGICRCKSGYIKSDGICVSIAVEMPESGNDSQTCEGGVCTI